MNRIRLPLAALALILFAACQSPVPTAPLDSRASTAAASVGSDSTLSAVDRNGNLLGSGN